MKKITKVAVAVAKALLVLSLVTLVFGFLGAVGYAGFAVLGPTFVACFSAAVWTLICVSAGSRQCMRSRTGVGPGELGLPADFKRALEGVKDYVFSAETEEEPPPFHEQAIEDRKRSA